MRLDGSERKTILQNHHHDINKNNNKISKLLEWPNGIALDRIEKRLYWGDGSLGSISSCAYDGSAVVTLMSQLQGHVMGVRVLGGLSTDGAISS